IIKDAQYIDIHSHVNFPDYDADRREVMARANRAGVAMIAVGVDLSSSCKAVELAEKHQNMWATIGLHPAHKEENQTFDIVQYNKLAVHPKTVAIGESGLDYYRSDKKDGVRQKNVFENMIDIANETKKPLMLHIRNGSGVSAYIEACEIIKSRASVLGNLHFFAGNIEEAKPFLDLGFYFSFTGVITFTDDYDEVIRYLPLERIMSETDCPYVTPEPHRGTRNEPLYVIEVVKAIARIRGEAEDLVRTQLLENAKNFFPFN